MPCVLALGDQPRKISRRLERHGVSREIGRSARRAELLQEAVAQGRGPADQGHKAVRIEIDVRDGGEKGLAGKDVGRPVADSRLLRRYGGLRKARQGIDQQILQGGHVRLLSADPRLVAPYSLGRLFTLVTKHGAPPSKFFKG